jgi:hypothetical protein
VSVHAVSSRWQHCRTGLLLAQNTFSGIAMQRAAQSSKMAAASKNAKCEAVAPRLCSELIKALYIA